MNKHEVNAEDILLGTQMFYRQKKWDVINIKIVRDNSGDIEKLVTRLRGKCGEQSIRHLAPDQKVMMSSDKIKALAGRFDRLNDALRQEAWACSEDEERSLEFLEAAKEAERLYLRVLKLS